MRNARRARLVLVLLLLTALTLITIDARSGSTGPLRRIGSAVFGPIENGASKIFRPVGHWFSGVIHASSLKSENTRLRDELSGARNRLAQEQADEQAFQRLEKLDGLANDGHYKMVFANVVSESNGNSLGQQWTIALDVGTADGVKRDETVMNSQGLVGRVIRVSGHSSTVLLACDKSFDVGSYVESNGYEGTVSGNGLGPAQLTLFNPYSPLKVGDRLVTVGDHIFAASVPIGTVKSIETGTTASGEKVAAVTPFVQFTDLGGAQVGVIELSPRHLPRNALLPSPPPSPSTSTTTPPPNSSKGKTSTSSTTSTPPATKP